MTCLRTLFTYIYMIPSYAWMTGGTDEGYSADRRQIVERRRRFPPPRSSTNIIQREFQLSGREGERTNQTDPTPLTGGVISIQRAYYCLKELAGKCTCHLAPTSIIQSNSIVWPLSVQTDLAQRSSTPPPHSSSSITWFSGKAFHLIFKRPTLLQTERIKCKWTERFGYISVQF